MKKRTVIALLTTVWMSLASIQTLFAQDSYRDAIEAYSESATDQSMLVGKEKFQKVLSALTTQTRPDFTEEQVQETVSKFIQDSLMSMVYDWMEESFKGVVSEEDLKKGKAFNVSPEGKAAMQHSAIYHDESVQAEMTKSLVPQFLKIATGEKPKDLKVEASKNYQKLFHEYYELTDMGGSMMAVLQQAFSMSNANGGMSQDYTNALMSYLDKNLEIFMMNGGCQSVTEDDLKALIAFYKTEPGKNITKASKTMMSNAIGFAQSLIMKYLSMIQK